MNEKLKPEIEKLAGLYLGKQTLDYGDENEKVEQQIIDAFMAGYTARTLSRQGKMPMSREDIEKFIYANERQLWNYTHDISGECCIGSNTVRKLLLSLHTAQAAPVSVEDVMKLIRKNSKTANAFYYEINWKELRTALQALFNPK